MGAGFSRDRGSLRLAANPGAKAGGARTSRTGPARTPPPRACSWRAPDFSPLTWTAPSAAGLPEGRNGSSKQAGRPLRTLTPHSGHESSHSSDRPPRPGGQAAGGRRPGFPHRPWALACRPAPARAPPGLGPTVTPWDQNPSPWTRKLTSPSLSDLPPCPPCRRTLWRQGPIPTTQAGRGGLSASPGSHGRGGVGPQTQVPLPPTPHTHRPLAPGGPPRPGRLQTHTKPAGARAADLWP